MGWTREARADHERGHVRGHVRERGRAGLLGVGTLHLGMGTGGIT